MGEIDLRRLRARLGNEEVRRQCLRGRQGNQVTTGQHGGTPVVGLDADTLPLDRGLPYLAKGRAWRWSLDVAKFLHGPEETRLRNSLPRRARCTGERS